MPIGNIRFADRHALRGEHVGLHDDFVLVLVHDSSRRAIAILLNHSIALVLFRDYFGRFQDRIENLAGLYLLEAAVSSGPMEPPSLPRRWHMKHCASLNAALPLSKLLPCETWGREVSKSDIFQSLTKWRSLVGW